MTLPIDAVEAKRAEVAHYERVLRDYRSGRWMDAGRRRLAQLRQELAVLEAGCAPPQKRG